MLNRLLRATRRLHATRAVTTSTSTPADVSLAIRNLLDDPRLQAVMGPSEPACVPTPGDSSPVLSSVPAAEASTVRAGAAATLDATSLDVRRSRRLRWSRLLRGAA